VTLIASGGKPPYAWSLANGSLPAGLSLDRSGVISGTPTAAGTSSFAVAVADSQNPPSIATATYSLVINAALQITSSTLPADSTGVAYSQTLAATGGLSPYSWTITQGSLPQGLTLNATSGLISGIPTGSGTSTFTAQVSDSQMPAATATASFSIVINAPPPRNTALYVQGQPLGQNAQLAGFAIASDGSLSALTTLPESFYSVVLVASPKLPLLFTPDMGNLDSLLVNPDSSLSTYTSKTLQTGSAGIYTLAVDPTGADLYVAGGIDASGTLGVTIVTADGSFTTVGTVAIPNVTAPAMVFTPDAKLGFISTCDKLTETEVGDLLSFVRNSDGTLSPAGSIATSSSQCLGALAVSADGKYLTSDEVQVYSIAADGTLTPVLPSPFTVMLNGRGTQVKSLLWDASGSYLIVGVWAEVGNHQFDGGVGVLSFSGTGLAETIPPVGGPVWQIQMTGSFVYAMPWSYGSLVGGPILGFNFQNGQLTPLPGSPYSKASGTMAIY
jgi:hypothetical protein